MNFTQWRNFHKLSQQQVVDGSKTSFTSVNKYEKGENIREDTRKKIEKYINSIDEGIYLSQKKDYRPKSLSIEDAWSYIPKEYSYIAKDKDDLVYLHRNKPIVDRQTGTWTSDSMTRLPINIYFGELLDWTECCFERPYNYWDYVGKLGVFFDNKNPEITILGKLETIDLDSDEPFKKEKGYNYSNFRPLTGFEKSELA